VVKFGLDTVGFGSSTLVASFQHPMLDTEMRIPLCHYTEDKVSVYLINRFGITFANVDVDGNAHPDDVVQLVKQQMDVVKSLYVALEKEAESAGCSEAEKQFEAVLAMAIPKY